MKKINILLIILVLILSFFSLQTCNEKNKLKKQNTYTIKALLDEVRVTKNKNGELEFKQLALLSDVKTLSKTNSELNLEINKLSKKDKKNLIDITKLQIEVNNLKDTLQELNLTTIAVSDTLNRYKFSEINEFRELSGYTDVISIDKPKKVNTYITTDKVFTELTIKKIENKDGIEFTVNSTNPNLSVNKINSAVFKYDDLNLHKKRIKYSINLSIAYSLGFNPLTGIGYIGPTVGVGIGYNIINF